MMVHFKFQLTANMLLHASDITAPRNLFDKSQNKTIVLKYYKHVIQRILSYKLFICEIAGSALLVTRYDSLTEMIS